MAQRHGVSGAPDPNKGQAGLGKTSPRVMPKQPGDPSAMSPAGLQPNQPPMGYTQFATRGYDTRGSTGSDLGMGVGVPPLQSGYAAAVSGGQTGAQHHQQSIPSVAAAAPTPQQQQLNIRQQQQQMQHMQQPMHPHQQRAATLGPPPGYAAVPVGGVMGAGVRTQQQPKKPSASASAVAAAIAQDEKARAQAAAAALAAREYAAKQAAVAAGGGIPGVYGQGRGVPIPVAPTTSSLPSVLATGAPQHMGHFSPSLVSAASPTGMPVSTAANANSMGGMGGAPNPGSGVLSGVGGGGMSAALFNKNIANTASPTAIAMQQQQQHYYNATDQPPDGNRNVANATTGYSPSFTGNLAAAPGPGGQIYSPQSPAGSTMPHVNAPWNSSPSVQLNNKSSSGNNNNNNSGGTSVGVLINVGLTSGPPAAPAPSAVGVANAGAPGATNQEMASAREGYAGTSGSRSGGAVGAGMAGGPATGPDASAAGTQEAPTALQAIQKINELRDAQYSRGAAGSPANEPNGTFSDEEGGTAGALAGRGQGWRSAHRGGAYSLSVGTRSGGARPQNPALDPSRATLGELAAKVQAEEKSRLSRAAGASGGCGSLPGIQGGDSNAGDANRNLDGGGGGGVDGGGTVAGAGEGDGGGGENEGNGSDSDGDSMGSDSDGEGGRLGGLCPPGTEQTGRWTKDEHDLFLKALKKYGKEWKRVACMVRTRTVVQTRTHAQKYFQKLTKAAQQSGGIAPEDGEGPDLMDIEVHMNTIDSSQANTAPVGSGAARTRGGAKRTRTSSAGSLGPSAVGGVGGAGTGDRETTRSGRGKRDGEEDDDAGDGVESSGGRGRRPRSNSASAAAAASAAAINAASSTNAAGRPEGPGASSSSRYGRGAGSRGTDDMDLGEQHPYFYAGYGGGGLSGYGRGGDSDDDRGGGGGARYGDVDRDYYYDDPRGGGSAHYASQRIGMITPQRGGGSGTGAGRGIDRRLAPSPPGEGSRKREELAVAELLASSSAGGRIRSRDGNILGSSNSNNSVAGSAGLRITNPDLFGHSGGSGSGAAAAAAMAATPWDGEVNNLSENLPAARGRMTPTDEISRSFAETYSSAHNNSSSSASNGSCRLQASGAGALHRNISQGQVAGALKLIEEAKAARDRDRARATAEKSAAAGTEQTAKTSRTPLTIATSSSPVSGAATASNSVAEPAAASTTPTSTTSTGTPVATAPTTTVHTPTTVLPATAGGAGTSTTSAPTPTAPEAAGIGGGATPEAGGAKDNEAGTSATPAAPSAAKHRTGADQQTGTPGESSPKSQANGQMTAKESGGTAAAAAAAAEQAGMSSEENSAATARGVSADSDIVDVEHKEEESGSGKPSGPEAMEVVKEQKSASVDPVPAVAAGGGGGAAGAAEGAAAGSGGGAAAAAGGGGDKLLDLVNEVDKFGFTPLMLAASMQRAPGDRGCIGTGPDTAYSLCEALLVHGANRAAADTAGNTALHWAAWVGNHLVVRLLSASTNLEEINRQNEEGDTALHFASRWGGVTAVRVLLAAGADADILNSEGRIPLAVAGDGLASEGNLKDIDRDNVRREFFQRDPTNRTLVLHHSDCLEHVPKTDWDWECPERVAAILEKLKHPELFDFHELEISNDFERVTSKALLRVHTSPYVKFVNDLSKQLEADDNHGSVPFTPMVQRQMLKKGESDVKPKDACDTSFSAGSLKAARRAAGAVTHAVDRVIFGQNRNAFCVVRPPGHHAGPSGLLEAAVSCGFCIFNNVAVGALHALEGHGLERVAIVDIDVHHGNGTEEICRAYPHPHRLLFFSVHLYDRGPAFEFFPGSGAQDYIRGNIINAPLNPLWKGSQDHRSGAHGTRSQRSKAREPEARTGRSCYREAVTSRLLPALRAFNPDLVLLSAGFDAAKGDVGNCRHGRRGSAGGLDLRAEDYLWTTERIQQVAEICCAGKMVSVLEGGYGQDTKNSGGGGSHAHIVRPTAVRAGAGAVLRPPVSEAGVGDDEHRRNSAGGGRGNGTTVPRSASYQAPDSAAQCLNRGDLGTNVAAHVRALVDPYRSQVKEEARLRRLEKDKDELQGIETDEDEPDRKRGRVGR